MISQSTLKVINRNRVQTLASVLSEVNKIRIYAIDLVK